MRLKLPFTARSAGSSLALVVSASLLLSACDGSGSTPTTSASPAPVVTETETANPVTTTRTPSDAAPSPTTSEPTGSESTNSPSPTALPPLGSPSMDQKQQAQVGDSDMSIAGIRVAEHETFTRVVFDIAGNSQPGWWVDWATDPIQQASGLPVEMAGDSFLNVNIQGTGYPDQVVVPGIDTGSYPGAGIVEDINFTSIFEARSQVLIGVSGQPRNYSVSLLQEPTRLVVDIVH
ncbi:hypothetical protein AKL15_09040 [Corynebacterium glutamicum]|uniref:AMIN-like domain-containing (lipo)protein n=1 Tax=Corynebacterium glutamicum TaxID=1718 RepID=UPI00095EDDE9|nr:hypothetical protein [Corynebacterium glutamicum]OKX88522.1 hypothetical protein AUO96_02615 [Corynebacterium glutamicum]QDX75875.1 hypothetical protein AKL15_09040 [Corynebacterium glutamicum]QDX78646.1 hypothetical protein AKL16_09040 [Corynebacterium glutamicum]TWS31853.1 hypothetical protein AKJ19_12875 [Corynebacterium glutamicum]TWS32805.1 hypothetical protein AKJ20_12850 [Corynebacterium glutamicum]